MYLSGLKPNLKKPELEGIGALKEVQVAVCALRCIDLNHHTLKVLGTHFSYNEKLKEGKNFYKTVTNIQRVTTVLKHISQAFLCKNSTPRIKHKTLCNDYKAGELKKSIFQTKL